MTDTPSGEDTRDGRRRRRSESLPPDPDVDDIAAALLGRPRSLARRDVSSGAAVSLLSARKLWHALGFPLVTSDEELFTEADLYALRTVAKIVREGTMDETTALAHTRAFARTADRLASWQVQLVAESISPQEGRDGIGPLAVPDVATAKAAALQLVDLVDELEPLLVYAWRRHLTDAISRMISDAEPSTDEHGMWRHIGFADLVAFTNLVRRLSERELSVVVKRFEVLTSDIVTAHGGRIIKTVGDEILFSNRQAAPAAATALDLVDAMSHDDVLPDVRVGMAAGPVLSRLGDVFGTTVNRASRLTSIAQPGNVLIDGQMAHSLDSVSGFDLTPLRSRALRGVGRVKPYVLARAGADTRRKTLEDPPPEDSLPEDIRPGDIRSREILPAQTEDTRTALVPGEMASAEMAPAEMAPAEMASAEMAPAEMAPAEMAPTPKAPAQKTPRQKTPAQRAPADTMQRGTP